MNYGWAINLSYRCLMFGVAMLMSKGFILISSNPNRRSASLEDTLRKQLGTPSITDPKSRFVAKNGSFLEKEFSLERSEWEESRI